MTAKCELDLETPKTNQVKINTVSLIKNRIDKIIYSTI